MIKTVRQRVGQSIYDLCMQTYGSLDLLVKFCDDNTVTNLQNIPQQVAYKYETTLVKADGIDTPYTTSFSQPVMTLLTESGLPILTEDGEYILPE